MARIILIKVKNDKVECLKIQNFIEHKVNTANTEMIFEAIIEDVVTVCTHQSMNYMIVKLLDNYPDMVSVKLVREVSKQFINIV